MNFPYHPAYLVWTEDDAKAFWLGIANGLVVAVLIAVILRRGMKVPV